MKISVVVATHNSPPELDTLVASLDEQTMDQALFEVIFVDDGSTDDTFDRLQTLARARAYVVLDRIPNSGWPGRPRNVGVRNARGEYVFFADHDDYLFPAALERMYAAASAADADVLHPKEVVQGWSTPGWRSWLTSVDRVGQLDQSMLQCITPHKLYRREFLIANDVWFPEGRVRLEDFNFNAKAWSRTDAIAILADYPCYRWVVHEQSSHKKGYDFDVYWKSFVDSLQPILELPPGPKRDHLLVRWYRSRILERLARPFPQYSEEHRAQLLEKFSSLLSYFPRSLDVYLTPADRTRSALLRKRDEASLLSLSNLDADLTLSTRGLRTRWQGGCLRLALDVLITDGAGKPLAVEQVGGRIRRSVPAALRAVLPDAALDLTEALNRAGGEIVIRSTRNKVDWILPTESEVQVVSEGDTGSVRISLAAMVDPRSAAGGRALDADVWEVFIRVVGLGYTGTRRLRARKPHRSGALVDGAPIAVVLNRGRFLQVDLSRGAPNITTLGIGTPVIHHGARRSRIDLPGLHVAGETRETGLVGVEGRSFPAVLVGHGGRAWIEVDGLLRGEGALTSTFFGHESRPLLQMGTPDQPAPLVSRVAAFAQRAIRRRAS